MTQNHWASGQEHHLPHPLQKKLADLLQTCQYAFPNPSIADPDGRGLIALGADLAPATLLSAYSQGMFPWFNEDEPVAWWCPEPRCVIEPSSYRPSKSLKRTAKKANWQITLNQNFAAVIHACSLPRSYEQDTWIHDEMIAAYLELHKLGFAHSIEVWQQEAMPDNIDNKNKKNAPTRRLIGGLYGLKIGSIYFGESMFHHVTDASKVAFWALMRLCQSCHMPLVDCQLPNPHLMSLGATTLPRKQFLQQLSSLITQPTLAWQAHNTAPPPSSNSNFAPIYSHQLMVANQQLIADADQSVATTGKNLWL